MKTVDGVYTSAAIFTDIIEDYALAQIQMLCDHPVFAGCKVRVMPDVHPGKVGTIGFTSTIRTKVMPNVVGIDIGCGITIAKLKQKKVEFQKLDKVIRESIPHGFAVRKKAHRFSETFDFSRLYCRHHIHEARAKLSLGTLGSGNHFLELDIDEEGCIYVEIHSGSRNLGKEVTEYYLNEGQKYLKQKGIEEPYELTWLEGDLLEQYLYDIQIVQEFAELNRSTILDVLVKGMGWKTTEIYSVAHNYIEDNHLDKILRKGAISARAGEIVVIPINMRDGILFGQGVGNEEWNYSAPHGSGRIMKREEIKNHYTVSQFKSEMKGIYSSCICKSTLDEAPFAYRGIETIQEAVTDTVLITKVLKPIFNFKSDLN